MAAGKFAWAGLYHLGMNMWAESASSKKLAFDEAEWKLISERMAKNGMNMAVIDLGEGVVYPSHPELAVEGSWSPDRLRAELKRLRGMGLEPIPKMNFSAGHDLWLGDYSRMLSTREYYQVCADLIRDVREIFDSPRLLHLGYDEEDRANQAKYDYLVIRQGELWWHDFLFFERECARQGMRPWIWTDYNRKHTEEFNRRMPRTVVQSNWYYDDKFPPFAPDYKGYARQRLQYYVDLDKQGFDQIPCASNWLVAEGNAARLAKFCRENVSKERLLGLLMAPWTSTEAKNRKKNLDACDQMGEAIRVCG